MTDTQAFARAMGRELRAFQEQRSKPSRVYRRHRPAPACSRDVIVVEIVVREKRIAADVIYVHVSHSISELEAKLEAQKAAKAAGYPIFGHLRSVSKESR